MSLFLSLYFRKCTLYHTNLSVCLASSLFYLQGYLIFCIFRDNLASFLAFFWLCLDNVTNAHCNFFAQLSLAASVLFARTISLPLCFFFSLFPSLGCLFILSNLLSLCCFVAVTQTIIFAFSCAAAIAASFLLDFLWAFALQPALPLSVSLSVSLFLACQHENVFFRVQRDHLNCNFEQLTVQHFSFIEPV